MHTNLQLNDMLTAFRSRNVYLLNQLTQETSELQRKDQEIQLLKQKNKKERNIENAETGKLHDNITRINRIFKKQINDYQNLQNEKQQLLRYIRQLQLQLQLKNSKGNVQQQRPSQLNNRNIYNINNRLKADLINHRMENQIRGFQPQPSHLQDEKIKKTIRIHTYKSPMGKTRDEKIFLQN